MPQFASCALGLMVATSKDGSAVANIVGILDGPEYAQSVSGVARAKLTGKDWLPCVQVPAIDLPSALSLPRNVMSLIAAVRFGALYVVESNGTASADLSIKLMDPRSVPLPACAILSTMRGLWPTGRVPCQVPAMLCA